MNRVEIDESGMDELVQKATEACLPVAEAAAEIARADHAFTNRSGKLEASISAWATEDGACFGSDAEYAAYVELGTRNAPAYPYLRPACDKLHGSLV